MLGTPGSRPTSARRGPRRERRARQTRQRSGAWLVSIALHVLLLTGLGRLASVERLASALEVFTVEPEPEAKTSTPAAPAARIARSVGPRPPRVSVPTSSVVQPAVIKPASEPVVQPRPVVTPPHALRDDLARGPEELQPAPAMPLTAAKALTEIGPPPATVVARDAVVLQADTQLPSSPEHEPVAAPPPPPPATEPRNIVAAPADTPSEAESPSNAAPAPATPPTTDVVPNVAAAPRSSALGLGRLK